MSSYIKSRKHAVAPLAALAATLTLPMAAQAQAPADTTVAQANVGAAASTFLPTVKVDGAATSDYKADKSASSKLTQPLLETPKTISIIKKEVLREQGAVSLMDALQNTPGITMQLGENGNTSAGDAFQMRGFSASSSTFVDGIRDLGAVTRDVFNLEQIEVVKGPAGADTGRGASAGYINLISKLPQLEAFTEGTFVIGDASRKRVSVDTNQKVMDHTAVRLNAVWQDNGVPGRDTVNKKTYAVAPSVAFGLGTGTRFFLYSQHVRQDNVPDGGIPAIGWGGYTVAPTVAPATAAALLSASKVNTSNFYGSSSDREKVKADMVTAKLEMDLGSGTTVRNVSRYGRTHMERTLTGIINIYAAPVATDAQTAGIVTSDPSTWKISRSRQRVDQTNDILANQTSLNTSFTTGGIKHDLSTGIELMYETQNSLGFALATGVVTPHANLYRPNAADVLPTPVRSGNDTDGSTSTQAVYLLDTLSITEALKLNGGLRTEHYTIKTTSGLPSATTRLSAGKWITSWNVGAVYKLADNGTVYAAAANSLTPPGSANFTLGATGQTAGTADAQETTNYELGTKWDLLNKRLNLTAALYRSENDGQVSVDPVTNLATQGGKTRVEGIELAAVGQITNFWQITAGVQTMDTKQINQRSASTATNPNQVVTDGVRWSPKWSATVWSSYQLGDFTFGGGVRHTAEQKRVITVAQAASTGLPQLPAYTVVDLMGAYRVNKNVNLQLNVTNLFDKEYMSSLNNGGGRLVLGAPRAVTLMASIGF
ncbi:TonB-dependent siderophore receptor [Roseateles amylovorans]|uniref:TonB-dependent siderophore receptor n=1 Tax=Roseateles amylovorans TaxID=2978473 RepID=A0ABY6B0T8_9BURK|nr:TonB-dependent siderophore receptor [Roseateles amylovorans]UXH78178.1 TonB-dependent siderophore receptor [Roseateles amylovorans]